MKRIFALLMLLMLIACAKETGPAQAIRIISAINAMIFFMLFLDLQ